jgi:hypothetical protein
MVMMGLGNGSMRCLTEGWVWLQSGGYGYKMAGVVIVATNSIELSGVL